MVKIYKRVWEDTKSVKVPQELIDFYKEYNDYEDFIIYNKEHFEEYNLSKEVINILDKYFIENDLYGLVLEIEW